MCGNCVQTRTESFACVGTAPAEEIMDGWWPDANEQREKVVKPHRDRFLPVTTLHPDGCYEWALDKPGLTTPLLMFGPGFASHGSDLHNIGGAHRVNWGEGHVTSSTSSC